IADDLDIFNRTVVELLIEERLPELVRKAEDVNGVDVILSERVQKNHFRVADLIEESCWVGKTIVSIVSKIFELKFLDA
ncbi:hypothetical protein PMAYCL1PPCAC_13781, partial [Pristionchus mayeri]